MLSEACYSVRVPALSLAWHTHTPPPPTAPQRHLTSIRLQTAAQRALSFSLAHLTLTAAAPVPMSVLAGTMKCDQAETPYLYLDDADPAGDSAAIHPKYLPTHVPHAEPPTAPGPYAMKVEDLQLALGLLETDADGSLNNERPKWAHADAFGVQRQELYSNEAQIAALSRGLPGTPAHRPML